MLKLIFRRLAIGVPLIFIVVGAVFVFIDLAPGDPATMLAGENPTPEQIEAIRQELRLDQPLPVRYAHWFIGALQGDLGTSVQSNQDVLEMITKRLGVTGSVVLAAVVVTIVFGGALGIAAALRPGSLFDRAVTAVASIAIAVPPFWLGMLLVMFVALNTSMFPAIGYNPLSDGVGEWARSLVLPGLALGAFPAAELAMQLRTSLTESMSRPYVLTAHAKGLSRVSVVMKHALKNAAMPVVTVFGIRLSQILGGTVTIETVFVLPGLGTLTINSVMVRDIPVVLGVVALSALFVVAINLVVDVSYGYFNPKVRT